MDTQKIGAYKEIYTLYCPTCRRPKDEDIAPQETCVTLRCLNCDIALASGHFIGFRAICLEYGLLAMVT